MREDAEKADIRSLCRPSRLKNKRTIAAIRFGKTFKRDGLTIRYLLSNFFMLGISIRKKVGCACIRNYIKRRSRHAFEAASRNVSYGCICMLYCTSELKDIKFEALVAIFREFFKEITNTKKVL